MSLIVKIERAEKFLSKEYTEVNDISFVGEYMILCMIDLRVRNVEPLRGMISYSLKEKPIVKQGKSKRSK